MKNADMPVSPMLTEHGGLHHHSNVGFRDGAVTGLTKRELFAAMAMQGFAADPTVDTTPVENLARAATNWADALLAELERTA